jgi:lipopolysaccharide/colanic/teichoic acid biosynthesis glycosyltransferase
MFERIKFFLDKYRIIIKCLLSIVLVVLLVVLLVVAPFIVWASCVVTIHSAWEVIFKQTITYQEANTIFWFIIATFFLAGLAFGAGKAVFHN